MAERHLYRLDLGAVRDAHRGSLPAAVGLRPPAREDEGPLAELILDAYRGTVDDEGEGPAESLREIRGWFEGGVCMPMPEVSVLAWSNGHPVAASLLGWWTQRRAPLVQYLFTAAPAKRQGYGRTVLRESLRLAADSGHREVLAVITEGNGPSETLFGRMGFARVPKS